MMEYGHGGDVYSPERKKKKLLDFSVNLNPLGLPPKVKALFAEMADDCVSYPDPYCRELTRALAAYEGIPEEDILCGNGAADLIYRIAYGLRPKKVLLPAPTFSEYEKAVLQAGGRVCCHLLKAEDGFALDARFLETLKKEQPDMAFLCNPNNPTGMLIEKEIVTEIADYCKAHHIYLIIDECFLDLVDSGDAYSMKTELSSYPDMMVLKAFTKFFAMAGLRLGYLLSANEAIREIIWNAGQPWSVSAAAQKCGVAALSDTAYIEQTKELLPKLGRKLYQELLELPVRAYPSAANYLLFETDKLDLDEQLFHKDILIRNCSNYKGMRDGYFRVAVKSEKDNERLIKALQEIYSTERH